MQAQALEAVACRSCHVLAKSILFDLTICGLVHSAEAPHRHTFAMRDYRDEPSVNMLPSTLGKRAGVSEARAAAGYNFFQYQRFRVSYPP
jgi:hypothetical protein